MRPVLCALVLIVASSPFASSTRADDDKELRAVIAKAIEAQGGEAKLAKTKAMIWTDTGTFYGMGAGVPYTGTYTIKRPDKFKMEIQNVFTIAFDGEKGWIKTDAAVVDLPEDQAKEQVESMHADWVSMLVPLKDKAYKLSALGETRVDGRKAIGLRVSRAERRDVNLYFDKENGLLVRVDERVRDEGGQEVNQETLLSKYEELDGVKLPRKMVIKRDGKEYVDADRQEIKLLESIDDKEFAKP